jgi:2-oxoglutarate ferredoxin oxidoreductase subunit delta
VYNWKTCVKTEKYPGGEIRQMAKKKLKEHRIDTEWCKGCGICVAFCPKGVLELDEKEKAVAARAEECIACKLCELRCPDLAIEVITEGNEDRGK